MWKEKREKSPVHGPRRQNRARRPQAEEMSANVERGIEDLPVWKEYVQRFGLEEARKILRRGLLINRITDGNPQN